MSKEIVDKLIRVSSMYSGFRAEEVEREITGTLKNTKDVKAAAKLKKVIGNIVNPGVTEAIRYYDDPEKFRDDTVARTLDQLNGFGKYAEANAANGVENENVVFILFDDRIIELEGTLSIEEVPCKEIIIVSYFKGADGEMHLVSTLLDLRAFLFKIGKTLNIARDSVSRIASKMKMAMLNDMDAVKRIMETIYEAEAVIDERLIEEAVSKCVYAKGLHLYDRLCTDDTLLFDPQSAIFGVESKVNAGETIMLARLDGSDILAGYDKNRHLHCYMVNDEFLLETIENRDDYITAPLVNIIPKAK